eukprot:CAMPEP_0177689442 /NCGR_PEP_ID=MMETSP0484_2-20121128/201_1 /TAXON_ID=354590 /ORGANISM="Rhodomonas lens, Strain RHODO" /LENGTH=703 /DNA_ID=CAMNT_0019199851 /DNA_START=9 /DNA_END=2117 /DNA_ORIENTATION=+
MYGVGSADDGIEREDSLGDEDGSRRQSAEGNREGDREGDSGRSLGKDSPGYATSRSSDDIVEEKVSCLTVIFDDSMRKPGSNKCQMIHPRSYFSQTVLAISTCALSYTAAVVPVVIAFEWNAENECEWGKLLDIDLTVDSFFIFDIALTFFVAECDKKGNFNDNWREVIWNYITGSFLFDLITAMPVSYAELWVYYQCHESTESALDPSKWKFARLIKPLKFVRIMRIYRAFASIDITYRLEKLLHIQPIAFSLFRVVVGIFATTHLAGCSFWMVKVLSTSPEDISAFLQDHGLEADAGVSEQYVLCCYFIVAIFTTVGFGDISATNTYEQIACMLLMMVGAMVFGTLLAEVQSGVSELRKLVREKGHAIQELKNFMRLQAVPGDAEKRILDWAEFEVTVGQKERMLRLAMERLTQDQRLELFVHMFSRASETIDLLNLSHHAAPEMHAHLWASAEVVVFEEGKVILQPGDSLHSMFVIATGTIRVEDMEGTKVWELSKGDPLGEWALMGDLDASSSFGFPVVFVAQTHLQVHKISREAFDGVLAMCPAGLVQEVYAKWARHQRVKERKEMQATATPSFRRATARWGGLVDKALKREVKRGTKGASASSVRNARLKNPAFGASTLFALSSNSRTPSLSRPKPDPEASPATGPAEPPILTTGGQTPRLASHTQASPLNVPRPSPNHSRTAMRGAQAAASNRERD